MVNINKKVSSCQKGNNYLNCLLNKKEKFMEITQIRSATIIVEYNNTKFLIDPWLAPKESMAGFDGAINSNIRQPRVSLINSSLKRE